MRIFKVARTDTVSYDEYDAFVAVAESEADARAMHPSGKSKVDEWSFEAGTWPVADPATLVVTDLGVAAPGVERGVVLASFNAG